MPGSGGGGKPPIDDPDLLKPLIFANNQRAFRIFNYVVAAAVVYYGVFVYPWPGNDRHCFSWIREYKERKKREIFHIDPSDPDLQRIREQHTADKNR